jgi:hypothetical protein
METKLGESGGDFAGLPLLELNPNPLADNLRQVEEIRGFLLQQENDALGGQGAIRAPAGEVNLRKWRTLRRQCGCLNKLGIARLAGQ